MVDISHLSTMFSILGMIVSSIVFLSPLPTFYNIYKKKSTEGYQSIPYVVALVSAIILIYYALLQGCGNGMIPVIIINAFGVFIETFYVVFYILYAPKKAKIWRNCPRHSISIQRSRPCQNCWMDKYRVSICTFLAPLCILRKVIKTKSVEYMPFLLSLFLTINAVMWFFYGLSLKNPVIYAPNILGFMFGVVQMVLYMVYKNKKEKNVTKEQTLPELLQNHVIILDDGKKLPHLTEEQIIDIWKLGTLLYSEKLNARAADQVDNNRPNLQTV